MPSDTPSLCIPSLYETKIAAYMALLRITRMAGCAGDVDHLPSSEVIDFHVTSQHWDSEDL